MLLSILSVSFLIIFRLFNPYIFRDFPLKYVIQEVCSTIFLLLGIYFNIILFVFFCFVIKLSLPPFHGWLLDITKKITSINLVFLLTLHKFYPVVFFCRWMITINVFVCLFMLLLIIIFIFNRLNMKEIIIYWSISSRSFIICIRFIEHGFLWFWFFYSIFIIILWFWCLESKLDDKSITINLIVFIARGLIPSIVFFIKIIIIRLRLRIYIFIIVININIIRIIVLYSFLFFIKKNIIFNFWSFIIIIISFIFQIYIFFF